MAKKYRVSFYKAEPAHGQFYGTVPGDECDVVVTASSKSDAVMRIAGDYHVYRFISVERIK